MTRPKPSESVLFKYAIRRKEFFYKVTRSDLFAYLLLSLNNINNHFRFYFYPITVFFLKDWWFYYAAFVFPLCANVLGCETKLAAIHNSFPDLAAAAVLCNILSIIIQGFTFAEVNKCPDQTTGCYYNALLAVSFWL